MPSGISRNAQDLIRRILVVDPTKRLTMRQIISHPWFSEVEPANLASLPVPPTPQEIGHPVSSAEEIDDRLLETIKFLWGENDQAAMVNALVSKEHNMQKVVYVLLQRHAEKYWQTEHDDEDESDSPDDQQQQQQHANSRRRYRTITYRPERDRRCLSMAGDPNHSTRRGSTPQRAPVPWVDDKSVSRRYSAATMRGERKGSMDASLLPRPQHAHVPPVPDVPAVPSSSQSAVTKSEKLKKSQTFYERFVRNVLPSRRQSKDTNASSDAPPVPNKQPEEDEAIVDDSNITLSPVSLTGTLRRKLTTRRRSKVPMVPPKSTLRGSNKVEPEQPERPKEKTEQEQEKQQKRKSLNPKRLSIRVPNLTINHGTKEEDDSRAFFTFNGGAGRRQRKQVMSVFDSPQNSPTQSKQAQQTHLPPPPGLSDGSTLSSSSSSSSSSHGSSQHAHMLPPTPVSAIDPKNMPPPPTFKTALVSPLDTQRRSSQATLGRRGSDQSFLSRPPTPSSTISENPPLTPATPKASWLSNLFFFKQPKVCSISVPHTDIADILRDLHRVMNKVWNNDYYSLSFLYSPRSNDRPSKHVSTRNPTNMVHDTS